VRVGPLGVSPRTAHRHAVDHDAGLQVATDEPQHPLVRDSLGQPSHCHIVVDPVEKFLEIEINHYSFPFLDVPLCRAHRLMCAASRSETVAVLREGRIEHRL